MIRNRRLFSRSVLTALVLFLTVTHSGFAVQQDAPEHAQQYRFALGLIQRHLYEEASKVLSRIMSDPVPFSQRDGVVFWMGECKYRLKRYSEAAGFYETLLSDFPSSTFRDRSAYGLGWSHAKDNNPKSAVEAFARVSRADRAVWIESRLKMGFLILKYGMDPKVAAEIYEELLKEPDLSTAQKYDAHLQVGIARFNESLFEKALEHFKGALSWANPEQKAGVQFYIGEALFRWKRFEEAREALQAVFQASPTADIADKAAYSLAWADIKTGRAEEARRLFENIVGRPDSPVRAEAARNLVDLLMNGHLYREATEAMKKAASILQGDEAVDMEYLRGLALSRMGEFAKSLEEFKEFIKKHPKHRRAEEARYQSSLVLISMGKFKEAMDELQPLHRQTVDPQVREKALYRTGECYLNLGNLTQARESFERVIREYPSGVGRLDALFQLGEIAYQSGRSGDALDAFSSIAQSGGELAAQATFRGGEVLMKAGRYVDAVKAFEDYATRFPTGTLREDALFKIGLCQLEMKDTGRALAAFSQLRESKGYFRHEARFQIGEIARGLDNFPLAIQQFKAIVTEEPAHPLASRARRAIGICLFQLKDFPAAIETFKGILKDYPPTDVAIPESRLWLGRCMIASDRLDDGILEVLKVPVLYPKSPFGAEAYAEAARAYTRLGNAAKASSMWGEVLKGRPKGPLADEAAAALKN